MGSHSADSALPKDAKKEVPQRMAQSMHAPTDSPGFNQIIFTEIQFGEALGEGAFGTVCKVCITSFSSTCLQIDYCVTGYMERCRGSN